MSFPQQSMIAFRAAMAAFRTSPIEANVAHALLALMTLNADLAISGDPGVQDAVVLAVGREALTQLADCLPGLIDHVPPVLDTDTRAQARELLAKLRRDLTNN